MLASIHYVTNVSLPIFQKPASTVERLYFVLFDEHAGLGKIASVDASFSARGLEGVHHVVKRPICVQIFHL